MGGKVRGWGWHIEVKKHKKKVNQAGMVGR